jgi:hypothetical protein
MVSVRHLESHIRRERVRARLVNPNGPAALATSVEDLAAFGEKRVGTPAGARAGAYLFDRFCGAGLTDVHFEEFLFPRHDLAGASLELALAGRVAPWTPGFDVFEGAGPGSVVAEVVHVGTATEQEVERHDLRGKVALVERNRFYHRSTQYLNVVRAGAAAMMDLSAAPDNLRQVGSIRRGFESIGPIPALTLGAGDGETLLRHLKGGGGAVATVEVRATSTAATGANVVGRIPGREPGQIVIGAHYDTWFTGSTDNGAGVAALLALAELRAAREPPRHDLVFVAWDGEEIALYGGYDFLRRHRVLADEPILAVLNFETPAPRGGMFYGLAHSGCSCLDHALRAGELDRVYAGYLPMSVVPKIFGGIIPTDIQGLHRTGVPSCSTAADSPYYHTAADTPDQVDYDLLVRAVAGFDRALDALMAQDPRARCERRDPDLWHADVVLAPRAAGEPLRLQVHVHDAHGAPQPGVPVDLNLLCDDFFLAAEVRGATDRRGVWAVELEAHEVALGSGRRFLHVGAGPSYPLCEAIVPVP